MICGNFSIFRKKLHLHYGLLIQFPSPFFVFILISPTVSEKWFYLFEQQNLFFKWNLY